MTEPGHSHHEHDHQHHGHQHGHVMFDSAEMAERTEREGEVLVGLVEQATARLVELAAANGVTVHRVIDLGCGPGVGTGVLAARFPEATLLAADGSGAMLERAAARAAKAGLADRITTRQIELPAGLADLDRADVVWASMVIHHIGDEADSLRRLRAVVAPGGLLAIVERETPSVGPTRMLPDGVDLGRPGLWDRLDAAWSSWFQAMRADLPDHTESAGYPDMLAAAGFQLVADEVLTLAVDPPLTDDARRWIRSHLERTRTQLGDRADPADLAALDTLLDDASPHGILQRPDALLRSARHLYVARNPASPT